MRNPSPKIYYNPSREHNPNLTRLVHLLLLSKERGKLDVHACIKSVHEGNADHIGVIGG